MASVALHSKPQDKAQKKMDTHTAEITEFQKQINAKSVELSQLSAERSETANELSRMKAQYPAEATVLDDLRSAARHCERRNKRAKVMRQCKESFTTTSTAAFSALLAKWEHY